ncbi:MAG: hypothetical protein OXF46_09440 [Rhodobacteraceae bacterium]|nr:hypothetical protein [Paracoccaceae bacterium]
MVINFKYYVWGNGSDWEGLCTTFDIAMEGTSLEETKKFLEEAVIAFLESLEDLPAHDRERLLKRKAPIHLRIILFTQYLRYRLRKSVNNIVVAQVREIDVGAHSGDA